MLANTLKLTRFIWSYDYRSETTLLRGLKRYCDETLIEGYYSKDHLGIKIDGNKLFESQTSLPRHQTNVSYHKKVCYHYG